MMNLRCTCYMIIILAHKWNTGNHKIQDCNYTMHLLNMLIMNGICFWYDVYSVPHLFDLVLK